MDKQLTEWEQQVLAWQQHPVTQALMQWAFRQREERKEDWAQGAFVASFGPEHFIRDAGAQGYCSAMNELMSIEATDLELGND